MHNHVVPQSHTGLCRTIASCDGPYTEIDIIGEGRVIRVQRESDGTNRMLTVGIYYVSLLLVTQVISLNT